MERRKHLRSVTTRGNGWFVSRHLLIAGALAIGLSACGAAEWPFGQQGPTLSSPQTPSTYSQRTATFPGDRQDGDSSGQARSRAGASASKKPATVTGSVQSGAIQSTDLPPAGSGGGPAGGPRVTPDSVDVRPGDTLFAIARRYRVSVRALIEKNGLTPPFVVRVGQTLTLPKGRQHLVAKGDTLFSVARQYKVMPHTLARVNGIKTPFVIRLGERLLIPEETQTASHTDTVSEVVPGDPGLAPAALPAPLGNVPTDLGRDFSGPPPQARARAGLPVPAVRPGGIPPRTVSRSGFQWPVRGRVISGFGSKAKGLQNDGINIAAAPGTPVVAARSGTVAYVGNELRGFGNLVLIKHPGGWVSAYAHNDQLLVKRGEKVNRGQKIATVGQTGGVGRSQLHFELRRGRRAIDPVPHLPNFSALGPSQSPELSQKENRPRLAGGG